MEAIKKFVKNNLIPDGAGFGNGFGTGTGYSAGFGNGAGDGLGAGFGTGSGTGTSTGNGSGSGTGTGNGNGREVMFINGQPVYQIDGVNTVIVRVFGKVGKGYILNSDLTFQPCYVVREGDTFAHGETLAEARATLVDKLYDSAPVEEKIKAFWNEFDHQKRYPAMKFYDWHHRLTGSCEMGRRAFAKDHGIDLEHDQLTVEEFIQLTKDAAYGADVIRTLRNMK